MRLEVLQSDADTTINDIRMLVVLLKRGVYARAAFSQGQSPCSPGHVKVTPGLEVVLVGQGIGRIVRNERGRRRDIGNVDGAGLADKLSIEYKDLILER